MDGSARSLYAQGKRIGVSDIGGCREYVRRLIADEDFSDPRKNFMAAFMGTAFGDHLEQAYLNATPARRCRWRSSSTSTCPGSAYHCRATPTSSTPTSTSSSMARRRTGSASSARPSVSASTSTSSRLYAKAAIDMGLLDEDCTLALAYYDRAGVEQAPHIFEWTYDPTILDEAIEWLK